MDATLEKIPVETRGSLFRYNSVQLSFVDKIYEIIIFDGLSNIILRNESDKNFLDLLNRVNPFMTEDHQKDMDKCVFFFGNFQE